ncbi:unnamed protein product [Discosporangium mesarthrocarpum]
MPGSTSGLRPLCLRVHSLGCTAPILRRRRGKGNDISWDRVVAAPFARPCLHLSGARTHLPTRKLHAALYGPAKWIRLYLEDERLQSPRKPAPLQRTTASISTDRARLLVMLKGLRRRKTWSAEARAEERIVGSAGGSARFVQSRGKKWRREKEAMDEETERSMGEGDAKVKKSIKTVKLALGGNLAITLAKFWAYWHSGSSAMLSEAVHSLVDSGNQMLLLVGLTNASAAPDKMHQYGYGKSVYFWSLISALGTFWMGAGVSLRHSVQDLLHPTVVLEKVSWETWGVLGFSFVVDGFVLVKTLKEFIKTCPEGRPLFNHLKKVRDPTTLAVLLEDGGACVGIVIAIAGLGMSQWHGTPVYDSIAGVCVASLLATMGAVLTKVNQRFLIGQAVDSEITDHIVKILKGRSAIENLHQVQSQWVGPYNFSFKAEVDIDGTVLAAKLMSRYEHEFAEVLKRDSGEERDKDFKTLLSFYAEDVMRAAEREVREAETEIRRLYPAAAFIELEPDSSTFDEYAVEHYSTPALRKLEEEAQDQFLLSSVITEGRIKAAQDTPKVKAVPWLREGKP